MKAHQGGADGGGDAFSIVTTTIGDDTEVVAPFHDKKLKNENPRANDVYLAWHLDGQGRTIGGADGP